MKSLAAIDAKDKRVGLSRTEYLRRTLERERAQDAGQSLLVDRGLHRAPSIPDLLIAATVELAELSVLHVDKKRVIRSR